jgi:hypothetical protein
VNLFERLSSQPHVHARVVAAMFLLLATGVSIQAAGRPSSGSKRPARPRPHVQRVPRGAADPRMVEAFSFTIKDYRLNHQSEMNTLDIIIRYRYAPGIADEAYPDFRLLLKDVEDFLTNYPNEVDYWEIVNKKLTLMLLQKYLTLSAVTCEMHVSPSQNEPYIRSSTVTRDRAGQPSGAARPPRRAR